MILNEINKKPVLTFGLGRKELTVEEGETVRVFQSAIFSDQFVIRYNGIVQNNYYFDVLADEVGTKEIKVELTSKVKFSLNIESDPIILTIE